MREKHAIRGCGSGVVKRRDRIQWRTGCMDPSTQSAICVNAGRIRASRQRIDRRCKRSADPPKKFGRRNGAELLPFSTPVTSEPTALAVIDGTLCQLTREGARAAGHVPLATGVVEFRRGSLRYYVREHPYGLLPGLPNLYCLDAAFRLQWMADWPDHTDPCTSIVGEEGDALVALSANGMVVRLDAHTGRLLRAEPAMAAAS
jgi:hypothetical protein